MTQPDVSVVMTACNVERFLAESIESILGQTCKNLELVIVDYGSTDNSKSIISSYAVRDSRIKFHEIPPCSLPVARNVSCSHARGRFIAVMDADDISLPDRLALEIDFMDKHPKVGFVGGAALWMDLSGRVLGLHAFPSDDRELRAALATRCPFWHPTLLIRKDAFDSIGGYRAAFVAAQDYDLELRLSEHYECANLTQAVIKYRIHPSQTTFYRQRQQTLCKLGAQVSASLRRASKPDKFETIPEITAELLRDLGLKMELQENSFVADRRNWIRSMILAGEHSAALGAALDILKADFEGIERWQISELHLVVARLCWQQNRYRESLIALAKAVLARPRIIGRPLWSLAHRVGLLRDRRTELA